jgi:uncharacterized membrane protein YphA (DoxX/SURF4 family)
LLTFFSADSLGLLLAAAGFLKTASLQDFILSVASYGIILEAFVSLFAITVVSAEITFGLSLGLGFFKRLSAAVLSVLLLLFLIATTVEITKCNDAACGCIGTVVREYIGIGSALKGLILLSVGIWLSFSKTHRLTIDGRIETRCRTTSAG